MVVKTGSLQKNFEVGSWHLDITYLRAENGCISLNRFRNTVIRTELKIDDLTIIKQIGKYMFVYSILKGQGHVVYI